MKVLPKKVQLTELFYDLVFVFAISKVTGLIHHVENAREFLEYFGLFAIVMIVFLNTWMVQTVYTNRYGKNSLRDIIFFMLDMAILLFMSNTFNGEITMWFRPFVFATGLLSLTLFLEYFLTYRTAKDSVTKEVTQKFMYILGFRTVMLLLSILFSLKVGLILAVLGILGSWILPLFFTRTMRKSPINFPHLLERLTLITIITFGETIVDIAPYFTLKTIGLPSLLIFGVVCLLFMTYITQFDHYIDEKRTGETGVLLIYLHYFILFGLSLITVALSFISETHFDDHVAVLCLYGGLMLFYIGILIAARYNQGKLHLSPQLVGLFGVTTILGAICSYLTGTFFWVTLLTFAVTLLNATSYIAYLLHKLR